MTINNPIELIANLLVAFGTIFLAIVSYKNVKIIRKQTKLIFSQSNFLRLQQTPLLKIEDLKFKGNEISLNLINIGNGIATQIGVRTGFYLIEPKFVDPPEDKIKDKLLEKEGISKEEWESVTKLFGKELWLKYSWNYNKELFSEESPKRILGFDFLQTKEISKAFPTNYITFLKSKENVSPILENGKTTNFSCVPEMGIKVGEKNLAGTKYPKYSQKLNFEELLDLCKENSIKFLGLKFDLIYKDLAENIQASQELINCVVYINTHKTIEEAVGENIRLDFFALGQSEIENIIGGTFEESYGSKHYPNYIGSFDEEFRF